MKVRFRLRQSWISQVPFSPRQLVLPLKQHAGAPAAPQVGIGDRVEAGQVIADVAPDDLGAPLHAPLTGTVRAVEPEIVIDAG